MYSIQLYVIKFVSDLWQVSDCLRVPWIPPPIKLAATILSEILLKVALNTWRQTSDVFFWQWQEGYIEIWPKIATVIEISPKYNINWNWKVIKFEILLVLTCKMKTGPFFFGAHLILIDMYASILPDITNLIYIFFTVTTEQMERKIDRNSSFYTKNNFLYDHKIFWNCIGGVMDWVFVKPKTLKLVFVASLLSTQH